MFFSCLIFKFNQLALKLLVAAKANSEREQGKFKTIPDRMNMTYE